MSAPHEHTGDAATPPEAEDVPWGGTELESGERNGGLGIQAVLYGLVAMFFFIIGTAYWFSTYEAAGTVMLLLAGMVMAVVAGYLGVPRRAGRKTIAGVVPHQGSSGRARHRASPEPGSRVSFEVEGAPEAKAWFPDGSLWPFAVGVGVLLFANGLLLGIWLWLPALAFLAFALLGFVLQSRRRE